MKRRFTAPRIVLLALALLTLAAWIAPKIATGSLREPLREALEGSLGRKVKFGYARFQLLPMPGIEISDFYVMESPAIGHDFAVYAQTLIATPRWSSLFGGPFLVSSITLNNASINLTRVDRKETGVLWNFSPLAKTGGQTSAPVAANRFPAIHIPAGRVNFKFDETKSIFYLLDTDIDLWPPDSPGGALTFRVRAQPARTDRRAEPRGFGGIVVNGKWQPGDRAITLDAKLEKSELSDVLTLFEGHESTILGTVWGDAHLAGPLSKIAIGGHLNLSDLHGWNQVPPGGRAWPLTLSGHINAPGQTAELQAGSGGDHPVIDARYRIAGYLGRPTSGALLTFNNLSTEPFASVARNLGIPLPAGLTIDGAASGAVGYSTHDGVTALDGQVRIANSTVAMPPSPPLHIAAASLRFTGSSIILAPAAIVDASGESASVEGSWDTATGTLSASLASAGMDIASLRSQVSVAGAPLIGQATSGKWRGSLRYSNSPEGWTGDVHLSDTDIPFEAFAAPLRIVSADASIAASGVAIKKINLSLGDMTAQGEYRYDIGAARPHRFRLALRSASGPALEKLFAPALHRGTFLSYAFNFGRVPQPEWLLGMRADGTLQIGQLDIDGQTLADLKARVVWEGTEVRLSDLQSRLNEAKFTGRGAVHLAERRPHYEIAGQLTGFGWRGGIVDADGSLTATGTGSDLLTSLRATGAVAAKRIDPGALDLWDTATAHFDFRVDRTTPKLSLTDLTIDAGRTRFTGGAETDSDGQLLLKISDGTKQIEASGALLNGEALKPAAR